MKAIKHIKGEFYNSYLEGLEPMLDTQQISRQLDENRNILKKSVGLEVSFDLIAQDIVIGGKNAFIFSVNGFVKDEVMADIMIRLSYVERDQIVPHTLKSILVKYIPHVQAEEVDEMNKLVHMVLSGASAIFIQGESSAIVVDVKSLPTRSIEEPDLERVVRGSRDGFTETLLTNVSLVRLRIRDPQLRLEISYIGRRSDTVVCLAYIKDIADEVLVDSVKKKLEKTHVDGIPVADKQLEELLINKGWNPFPMVRYSERPDVVAVALLEGNIVLFVETSPSVMILPTTFFNLIQHVEEYRQTPLIGSYLRWVRYLGILISLFLLPVWFLLVTHPELKPEGLEFLGPKEHANLPIIVQILIAEIGIDLLRMASIHTPAPLASALGLIAAILIGDIAVKTGLWVDEVILYISVAAIGMYATPSYELGLANRIIRLVLLIIVAVFKVPGLIVGATVILLYLIVQRSYNTPYMWPFIPFNAKALFTVLVRQPFTKKQPRPSINKTLDSTRKP
jgi:stage V sporulation protein AF